MQAKYPSSDTGAGVYGSAVNPWEHALARLHGKEALDEGRARLNAQIAAGVTAAPSMYQAFEAAAKGVDVSLSPQARLWPAPVVRALWDKAAAIGALDDRVAQHARPPATVPRYQYMAAGHKDIYKTHDYQDWLSTYSVANGTPTLRRFLQRVAPATLRDELTAETPAQAEAA